MKAFLEIDWDTPQARKFVEYARTLPFVKLHDPAWDEAMTEEGMMSLEEFSAEFKRQTKLYFAKKKKNARAESKLKSSRANI